MAVASPCGIAVSSVLAGLVFPGEKCSSESFTPPPFLSFQVAIIAGNFELAEIIKTHKESDVVPFRETPSYTKRRRITGAGGLSSPRMLQRSASDNNLKAESHPSYSPVPSLRSLPPQLLAQMQEAAVGAGVGDSSLASTGSSRSTHSRSPSLQRVQEEKEADMHTLRRSSRGKASPSQAAPPGPGPGPEPARHAAPAALRGPKRKLYSAVPGRRFIVVKSYAPLGEGEIQLNRGEAIKAEDPRSGGICDDDTDMKEKKRQAQREVPVDPSGSLLSRWFPELSSARHTAHSGNLQRQVSKNPLYCGVIVLYQSKSTVNPKPELLLHLKLCS
ncbi:igLON family member 5 [Platysternon megacephalum]|uniref:IgLON family member 5 n=1 Tax=Platysternon megacephalum TaxID=55544 RepID=A0A4D9DNP6_9SAUR|nr:igLON family member 5 [Platysternon megacephalum]